jgi:DtxR family transcriptional regulator, Mn-dependent transcriptional regulator
VAEQLTRSDREMLKAIYRQTIGRGLQTEVVAHTGDLADAMGTSPGTATSHVKRLADRDLVVHTPYVGVALTETGRSAAIGAIRRHRIVERFLSDMLGYEWTDADRLATSFEHDLPDEVEQRLFAALGEPTACPHGFPIPAASDISVPSLPQLYDLVPGDIAEVAVPGSTDPDVIEYLASLGLRPGTLVEVREKEPFDGPVLVRVEGHDRALGRTVATQVFVRMPNGTPPRDAPAA